MKRKLLKLNFLFFIILNSTFLISNTLKAQLFWNQAGSFAGTNSSYLKVSNSSTNNITGSFTLEAWVNPSIFNGFSKGVISKGGALGATKNYAMRLQSTGRFDIYTNGALRLTSKTSVPLNQWSHIAATYNSTTSLFSLYLNGTLDTSATKTGSLNPVSNTDSLFIGIAGINTPFVGMLDEVRIWNRALSSIDIIRNMRISLGTTGGYYYNGLIMSLTFQAQAFGGNVPSNSFSTLDYSTYGNHAWNNGVTDADLSDVPSKTIAPNLCLDFSFTNDYLACEDHPALSPTTGITLQCWVYPRANFDRTLIHKGPATGGAATNYSLNVINQKLAAKINGGTFDSQDTIPLNQWSHVAFTYYYDGLLRYYSFYVNGKRVKGGFGFGGSNITDGPDSLYIGGTNFLTSFYGYIDEVRISPYAKSQADITDSLYMPLVYGHPYTNTVSYNFDGYTWCNTFAAPFLYFRNSAGFTNPSIYSGYPVSPLNSSGLNYYFQKGFYLKTSGHTIPSSGSSGSMIDDTLNILLDENINDINVYVGLNHTNISQLQIDLIAPNGSSVHLINHNTLVPFAQHAITVFDDQSSTPLLNNSYTSFSPSIRPSNNMGSVFNGMNTKGIWRLAINDNSPPDTGRLYAWGIEFNNKSFLPKIISANCLIQGFYNLSTNAMTRDTVKGYLRNTFTPYNNLDSSKIYLQTDGSGIFSFDSPDISKGNVYYLQLSHRNSIETWSNYVLFDNFTSQASYDFTTDSTQAFGNNLIQVDNSPVEFAVYNGDVNQDGTVDATDLSMIDNDAFNFATGYLNTDLTGDDLVDASDALIAENNAANFVSAIRP